MSSRTKQERAQALTIYTYSRAMRIINLALNVPEDTVITVETTEWRTTPSKKGWQKKPLMHTVRELTGFHAR